MNIIELENISKKYIINHFRSSKFRYKSLRETIYDNIFNSFKRFGNYNEHKKNTREEFWALKDISFSLKESGKLGIIGRNGAGKSTLLKILSRITEPSKGIAKIRGRVASLLEVGTGFHPELTGKENIYLNGSILGMTKAEIKNKFDEIISFAEIEKFLDTPVKRYSSGMYVRLAFSVAAHLDPEILLIDEVLAVGDSKFQEKCIGKMQEINNKLGRTVLFVSHNLSAIQKFCTQCILLENGLLKINGDSDEVIKNYLESNISDICYNNNATFFEKAIIKMAKIHKSDNVNDCQIELIIESKIVTLCSIDLRLRNSYNEAIAFGSLGTFSDDDLISITTGSNRLMIIIDTSQLAIGKYLLSMDLTKPDVEYYDRAENCITIEVTRPPKDNDRRILNQSWGFGSLQLNINRKE